MPTPKKKTGAMIATPEGEHEAMCEWVDRHTVRFVRDMPHSVERVWRALSEADEIARWFIGPVEIDLRVGGAYKFGSHFAGVIQRLEPPRLIEFEGWGFELEPIDEGSRLIFTDWIHRSTAMFGPPDDPEGRDQPFGPGTHWPGVLVGWHGFLNQLRRSLDDPDGYYGYPLSEADQAVNDARDASGQTASFIADYRRHMLSSPVLIASGRQVTAVDADVASEQRDRLRSAVIGRSDDEIAHFAGSVGGYGGLLGLVFERLAGRINPDVDLNVGFVLGNDLGFVFRVKDGRAKVDKRVAKRAPAIFRSTPADFLRVITNDLDVEAATASGRITIDGDAKEVRRLFDRLQ